MYRIDPPRDSGDKSNHPEHELLSKVWSILSSTSISQWSLLKSPEVLRKIVKYHNEPRHILSDVKHSVIPNWFVTATEMIVGKFG